MAKRTTNPSFMNGVPELLVLRMLSERAMYGYELVQAIRASTNKVIAPGEGVIYPILHGLERKHVTAASRDGAVFDGRHLRTRAQHLGERPVARARIRGGQFVRRLRVGARGHRLGQRGNLGVKRHGSSGPRRCEVRRA